MERAVASSWKLPVLSGAILGLAYYVPVPVLNFVAFVPLLYWLDRHSGATAYQRFTAGFRFGLATHLVTLYFVYALLRFTWLSGLLYFLFAAALALRISLTVMLVGRLRNRTGWSFGLLLPVAWLPLEWLQTFGDLRMTGDHLAHTLAGYPFLIQFADLVGHYGVGAFLLCSAGLLYEALLEPRLERRRHAVLALAVLFATVLSYDLWAWTRPAPPGDPMRIALVQPNIALTTKMDAETRQAQYAELVRLSREAAVLGPELIVWPETARPAPVYHWVGQPQTYAIPEVQRLAAELGIPLLIGAEYVNVRSEEDYDYYNAAMVVDATGQVDPVWSAKVYLVPFAEALPFERVFGSIVRGRGGEWRWIAGGFSRGPRDVLLEAAGARIGVLVCYEQLFPDLSRRLRNLGAEFQVVITNDAWFGRSAFQRYQANVVRLRAIENRTDFVRVANTGISGFVDRFGRYHERTRLFESAVEVHEVRRSTERTPYDRSGDVVIGVVILGLVAAAIRQPSIRRYNSGNGGP